MNTPTRSQIEKMMAATGGLYVSVYMPTHRCGAATLQDPIRLKNLIREAERQLQMLGRDPSYIEQLIRPLTDLVGDYEFWQHQMDGLMIFRGEELFEFYQVDIQVPELAVVAERPHLKPMLAFIGSEAHFYVLSLSQKQAKLYQGARDRMVEVEVEGMPRSFDETWPGRAESAALQAHSASSGKSAARSSVFHGQGAGDEITKERLHIYCHQIGRALRAFLSTSTAPLILAAGDQLASIYRKANSYARLQSAAVSGNPDVLSVLELHARALPIALECFEDSRRKAADRYFALWHTQRASNGLRDVLSAAMGGRVETLFTPVGRQMWGAYNGVTGEVVVSDDQSSGLEDLLNLAAIQTYLKGGAVYAVPPGDVPGGGLVAAVYRY